VAPPLSDNQTPPHVFLSDSGEICIPPTWFSLISCSKVSKEVHGATLHHKDDESPKNEKEMNEKTQP
jgi:hypothetical protein